MRSLKLPKFKANQLTPWFPESVKPVHVGPYPIRIRGLGIGDGWVGTVRWWTGKNWQFGMAAGAGWVSTRIPCMSDRVEWRGLREPFAG